MAITGELIIQGTHVQTIYSDFIKKRLLVNRNYQRKLVWTIEEKRNFIDTLSQSLPIPLFLLAETSFEEQKKLEIIDGMQRFDAIFSFIEQKYGLKDGFFDLSVMTDSQEKLEKGELEQRYPILDKEYCRNIVNYLIPISKSTSLDDRKIEETFRRINSNGRHLSNQELRHAGTLGAFPNLVRILATEIRKDISADILNLNEMSKISITQRRLGYYGVSALDMFWVKNHLISPNNIRNSTDEEIIAFLIADMILPHDIHMTANMLNQYYGYSSNPLAETCDEVEEISTAMNRVSPEVIQKNFRIVFSLLEKLTIKSKKTFNSLIFNKTKASGLREVYHTLFMTFFELIVKDSKKVQNWKGLINSISGIGDDLFSKNQQREIFKGRVRRNIIKSLKGRIEEHFIERNTNDPIYEDWTLEFEKLLMSSITEQNQYDFKIGLTNLQTGEFNEELILKITKTLSAIANLGPKKVGYVIIGVADQESDAKRQKEHFGDRPYKMQSFNISGVKPEADKYHAGIDKYLRKIKDIIKKAPITPESFKNDILTNIHSRQYHGKEILIFRAIETKEPIWYDGKLFERHLSHNEQVRSELHSSVYSRFYKNN